MKSRAMPATASLVGRLAAMPELAEIPRAELEWLASHATVAGGGPVVTGEEP